MIRNTGARYAPLLARPVTRRPQQWFHSTPDTKSTVGVQNTIALLAVKPAAKPQNPGAYLKDFTPSELMLYFCIGMATLNKPILNMCIKAFPYVPMWMIKTFVYKIYCGGETIEEVKATGERLATQRGINNMMISLTIEACDGNDNVDPEYIVKETARSVHEILVPHTAKMIETTGKDINLIPPGYVALKPTGFAHDAANVLRYYNTTKKAEFEDLVAKALTVVAAISEANAKLHQQYPDRVAPFVVAVVDAEKHELQEGVYELQRRLYQQYNPLNLPAQVVGTLQMYLSELAELLAKEEKLAKQGNYRLGLKLVRGAYIHSEKQRDTIIHATKEDTDANYNQGILYCIDQIMSQLAKDKNTATIGHLVVASHNGDSLKLASQKLFGDEASRNNIYKANVVLGQLLGMADNITYSLTKNYGVDNVIKYVPWGPPLETKEYLLRRMEENGDAVRSDNGFPLVKAVCREAWRRVFA